MWLLIQIVALSGTTVLVSCNRSAKTAAATTTKQPRVVSLVPSASDIIEGVGIGEHLVAVSNYDTDPLTANLPRVGDYMNTDWERIAPLHPQVIITQYAPGRTPEGFSQRLLAIGATQLNIHLDRLEEIYATIRQIADACGEHDRGMAAQVQLKQRIDAVRNSVAGEPAVPALIVLGPEGTSVAGSGTFLDELLAAAGGVNVASGMGMYPSLDHEQLVARKPAVIIQILPSASPQVILQAQATWESLGQVPAVRDGRVVRLTEWYVMHSGYQVGTMAEQFARILHPAAATQPSTIAPSPHN